MEFVMNYGWAILVVLVAIGALAYFGVLNLDKFVPRSCVLKPGIGCDDFKVNTNSVTFVLRNGIGKDLTISSIEVEDCTGAAFGTLNNGQANTYVVDGCNNGIDSRFDKEINISYTTDTGISHVMAGKVVDTVENGTGVGQLSFIDYFNRDNNTDVNEDWVEWESDPSAEAQIIDNRLDFDAVDDEGQPRVQHTFTKQSNGTFTWTFIFNFERTENEKTFEVFMQLGDSALMVNPTVSDNTGVAVNLKWAGLNAAYPGTGFPEHEGFGYVNGASLTQVGVVSGDAGYNSGGDAQVSVTVNMNTNTYNLVITGDGLISGTGSASNVPFDNDIDIDAVRIYLDKLNSGKFEDLEMDDIIIRRS